MKIIENYIITILLLLVSSVGMAQDEIKNSVDSIATDSVATDSLAQDSLADAIETTSLDSLPYPQRMQEKICLLLGKDMFKRSQVGLMIYDLDADSTLFAYNELQQLRPASTMKLLTAITALKDLGSDYRYHTTIYTSGQCDSTSLQGSLYVKGGMDPTFGRYDMDDIIKALRQLKIDTICGNLVADRSFKDDKLMGEGWCWDDDNPVLTPLPFKRKDNFLMNLRVRLDEEGIAVLGRDSIGPTPRNADILTDITTQLPVVLTKMMKESDNLYAESMYYQLASLNGRKATAKSAQAFEKQLISKAGIESNYRLADGSGLSLYNYLSAEFEVKILKYAYKDKQIYDALLPSLPVAGVDGTLKKRMTTGKARGNVKAKTGTLTGVASLAGYATSPEGHTLAFCIINQGVMRSAYAKSFQNSVCEAMCK